MKTQLLLHEWLAVATIVAVAILLTIIAFIDDEPPMPPTTRSKSPIVVTIRGAVEKPGEYEMTAGDTMANLLAIAKPTPNADLRRHKSGSRLRHGREIVIAEIPMITVHVHGAVEQPGNIQVKKGILLKELIDNILLDKAADTNALNSCQRLRHNQSVYIPFVKNSPDAL